MSPHDEKPGDGAVTNRRTRPLNGQQEWGDRLAALLIFVVAVVAYGHWRTAAFLGDDLQYAAMVREAVTGEASFHPAGIRYLDPSTGRVVSSVPVPWPVTPRYPLDTLSTVGWARVRGSTEPILAIQGFRAVSGALALLFVFLALRRWGVSRSTSVLITTSLAVSRAFWEYSTHVDYSITAVTVTAAAIWAGGNWLAQPTKEAPPLGMFALLVAAALYNVLAVLTGAALLFAAILGSPAPVRRRVASSVGWVGCLLLAVAGAVVLLSYVFRVEVSVPLLQQLSSGGVEFAAFEPAKDMVRAALGFSKAFLYFPGLSEGSVGDVWPTVDPLTRVALVAAHGGVLVLVASVLIGAWTLRERLGERRSLVLALVLSLLLHGVFNWLWAPSYAKFWTLPLTTWWLAAAILLDSIEQRWARAASSLVILAFGAALGLINFVGHFRPAADPARQPLLQVARQLAESPPSALYLSVGHPVDFYIVYFARRNVVAPKLVKYNAAVSGSSDLASIIDRHVLIHRLAGGPVFALEKTDGGASGDDCWEHIRALTEAPNWSAFGLTTRPLRFREPPALNSGLCR